MPEPLKIGSARLNLPVATIRGGGSMQSIRSFSPVLRAIGVIGVVAALVTSITFAALQSSATLTGNTVASASAELLVDGNEDGTFASSEAGFAFTGLVPGGSASTVETFDLRNNGDVALDVAVSIPTAPTTSGTVDLTLVDVILSCTDSTNGDTFAVTDSVQDLVDAHATGGVSMLSDAFEPGASDKADCDFSVQMQSGAVTGTGATVDAFDLEFTGTNTAEVS